MMDLMFVLKWVKKLLDASSINSISLVLKGQEKINAL